MSPLERLFRLEIDYHARLRTDAPGTFDDSATHTSFALLHGYEALLRAIPRGTTIDDLVRLSNRFHLGADERDVFRARDSITRILGLDSYLTSRIDRDKVESS
jgi:hypothetical protein